MLESSGNKEPTTKFLYAQTRKFIQLAREKLDPALYCDLVDALSTFKTGTLDKQATLRSLRRILQKSAVLREKLSQLLPEPPAPDPERAAEYIEKIKAQGPDVYDPFVSILLKYQLHEISFQCLLDEAEKILQPFPELFDEFLEFTPSEQQEEPQPGTNSPERKEEDVSHLDGKSAEPEPPVIIIEDVKAEIFEERKFEHEPDEIESEKYILALIKDSFKRAPELYISLIKSLSLYMAGVISTKETMALTNPLLENNPYLQKAFEDMLAAREKTRRQDTWLCRPLSDFHPSSWANGKVENPDPVVVQAERMGNYTKLPQNYPLVISTGRNPTGIREINDQWFTVAKGSEDYSFKSMRRNMYEDALFRCEDERFELDVAINNFSSCVDFLATIQKEAIKAAERGEDYEISESMLRSPKLKPIGKAYGDSAPAVISKFQANPIHVIPVILYRINQQKEALIKKRAEQNRIWKEICEKNYHKSLDHKAFYFKQTERKHTNTKGFIQEIKTRYSQRTWASVNLKRGGNENSIYFNSLYAIQPEDFHCTPVEGDDLKKLTDSEISAYAGKLPQYQMLWHDSNIFKDTLNLIMYQIEAYRNSRGEKDRILSLFRQIIEAFFKETVEKTCEFDSFTPLEIHRLSSDSFVKRRLTMPDSSTNQVIDSMKSEHSLEAEDEKLNNEMQRKLKTGRNRIAKISSHGGMAVEPNAILSLFSQNVPVFEKTEADLENALFIPTKHPGNDVLYAPQHFYGIFRHMYCIYERLYKARSMIYQGVVKELHKTPEKASSIAAECYSTIFLKGIRTHIGGCIDATKYEDFCRHYLGQQAYLLFTIESLTTSVSFLFAKSYR